MVHKSKITIGIPVFNGEKSIKKTLDSIVQQTFTDFHVIISDNHSTDNTEKICKEYSKKYFNIEYYRQNENKGPLTNFKFVLDSANSEYFVWLAADDWWEPTFLEKNINILQKNNNFVGSLCSITNQIVNQKQDFLIIKIIKKILHPMGPIGLHTITGTYYNKVRFYLKNSSCNIFYSVFRTNELKKGIVNDLFLGSDWAHNLNMLRFGDVNIIDEELMFRSNQGNSSKNIISLTCVFNKGKFGKIFPWYPFTLWCGKNLGLKIFLRNIDYFMLLNYTGFMAQLKQLYFKFKNK